MRQTIIEAKHVTEATHLMADRKQSRAAHITVDREAQQKQEGTRA
jgi:hypothetical protein